MGTVTQAAAEAKHAGDCTHLAGKAIKLSAGLMKQVAIGAITVAQIQDVQCFHA